MSNPFIMSFANIWRVSCSPHAKLSLICITLRVDWCNKVPEATQFTRRWLKSATLRFGLNSRKIYEILPCPVRILLFVCKGNICRSPFAASYLGAKLKERDCPIEVFSAGLETKSGEKANPVASSVALQDQISLEAHVPTPVTRDLIGRADLIVVMEFMQCVDLLQKFPG